MSNSRAFLLLVVIVIITGILYCTYELGQISGRNEIFSGFAYDLQVLEANCFNELDLNKRKYLTNYAD